MSKGKQAMSLRTPMGYRDSQDKENRSPMKRKNAEVPSSLSKFDNDDLIKVRRLSEVDTDDLIKVRRLSEVDNDDLTKVRRKTPARVTPLTIPSYNPSPLSPTAEEFQLPPHISALPANTNLSSLFSTLSLTPPFSPHLPPPPAWQPHHSGVTAVVEQQGYISLRLRHDVVLDISANQAIRLTNNLKNSSMSLSACTTQMALVHPKGRILQYGNRVEVQTEDEVSVKNAKIYPRGISFTANNMALVYLLDEAGARSTSDMFHDLYATQISDTLFMESCQREGQSVTTSIRLLDMARYWRTEAGVDCWVIGHVFIQQTEDGLVTVERELQQGDTFVLKTSPSNGKVRFDSRFVQLTASLGDESHMFLRSGDRRLHYSGQTKVFTVRNAGHSAGFDEEGELRIF
eukprot:GFUD01020439.1.p1 GENE.GFUD01020439.1~~GFUD01020439.1.p1  ORF type:complete len:402 (-),score=104.32 GFUD01020439.1:270-1475(-)